MNFTLGFLPALLVGAALLAKAIDVWLSESERERLRNTVRRLLDRAEDSRPSELLLLLLHGSSAALDGILGARILSRTALLRSALISFVVLVISLGAVGVRTGHPMAMEQWPWERYSGYASRFSEMEEQDRGISRSEELDEADRKATSDRADAIEQLASYDTPGFAILYSVILVIAAVVINVSLDAGYLALTRHFLRRAIADPSLGNMASIILTDLIVAAVGMAVSLITIWVIAVPLLWPALIVSPGLPIDLVVLLGVGLVAGAWVLGGAALRVIALTAFLPGLLIVLSQVIVVLAYPIRKRLRALAKAILQRAREHKGSAMAFSASLLSVVAAIITFLESLFD